MTLPITPFLAADAHPLLRGTSRTLPGLRIRILLRSCLPVIVLLLPVLCVAGITDTAGVRALALVDVVAIACLFGSASCILCLNRVLACDAPHWEGGIAVYSPQKRRRTR